MGAQTCVARISKHLPEKSRRAFLKWWTGEKERAVHVRVISISRRGYLLQIRMSLAAKYPVVRQLTKAWRRQLDLQRTRCWTRQSKGQFSLTDGWGDIIEEICNDRAGASASDDVGIRLTPKACRHTGRRSPDCGWNQIWSTTIPGIYLKRWILVIWAVLHFLFDY